jgi:UDP-N-acetylglucosamine 1-carboxyvinyltransferase
MRKYLIEGGHRLAGTVEISGAKNSALKLLAASIMGDGTTRLSGIPRILDVQTMCEVLVNLGIRIREDKNGDILINPSSLKKYEAPYELVRRMRASILVMGPLLSRLGRARIAMPGGCNIGSRQIDLHLKGLACLGAEFSLGHGYIDVNVNNGLKGSEVYLDFPSVGATENVLMAAVMAKGTTVVSNAAREPEICDLANFLNSMGARIEGIGTSTIQIEGVRELHGTEYRVIPDRVETGTFIAAAMITGSDMLIRNTQVKNLEIVISKYSHCGVEFKYAGDELRIVCSGRIKPTDISTLPYPGFPTDLQAISVALLSLAGGMSIITENVFDNRFMYVDELNRMGANIKVRGHQAVIIGVNKLSSAPVRATDLRAGAALSIAALAADGVTEISDIEHIERGYENFDEKLSIIGARIKRVK